MLHFEQKTSNTCGSACYRMIISQWELISEKQAVDEVLTKKSGTFTSEVYDALKKRDIECILVHLNTDFDEYSRWLYLNSIKRILYLSCEFIGNSGKGRNHHRQHAILVSDGHVYDPAKNKPCPLESYYDTFRKLIIDDMIVIDKI